MVGRCIHRCIDDIEEMGVTMGEGEDGEEVSGEEVIGEGAIGEGPTTEEAIGEEVMVDASKELALEEGATSPIVEGATPSGMRGVKDALAAQVSSIDTLLEDIYELKY